MKYDVDIFPLYTKETFIEDWNWLLYKIINSLIYKQDRGYHIRENRVI